MVDPELFLASSGFQPASFIIQQNRRLALTGWTSLKNVLCKLQIIEQLDRISDAIHTCCTQFDEISALQNTCVQGADTLLDGMPTVIHEPYHRLRISNND